MRDPLMGIKIAANTTGSWVQASKRVPASTKLTRHTRSAHNGKTEPSCNACKELSEKANRESI